MHNKGTPDDDKKTWTPSSKTAASSHKLSKLCLQAVKQDLAQAQWPDEFVKNRLKCTYVVQPVFGQN
jgi:hypothetical protein